MYCSFSEGVLILLLGYNLPCQRFNIVGMFDKRDAAYLMPDHIPSKHKTWSQYWLNGKNKLTLAQRLMFAG